MSVSLSPKVAVIGGGAAGLMSAIAAAEAGAQVTVIERCDRVGRKLLATGNGRCNLTNLHAQAAHYHGTGAALAARLLKTAPPRAVLTVFEGLGLLWQEEDEGRVYPHAGQASAVLDVLRLACARLGVETRCGQPVRALAPAKRGFALTLADGASLHPDRVVAAAGGKASPQLGSDGSGYALLTALGHRLTPCFPALVQLRCNHPALTALKGLRAQAEAALIIAGEVAHAERGEVLFADYGLSGIATLSLAREAAPALAARRDVQVRLALLPDHSSAERRALAEHRRTLFAETPAGQFATGLLPRRIGEALCKAASIPLDLPCAALSDAQIDALAALLGDWRFPVTGVQPFEQAQITVGGIDARDFDSDTLESLLVPGLYAAGELLDVDGACGGFNLQFAWASGLVAGRAAAGNLITPQAE